MAKAWRKFEQAVATFLSALDPAAKVRHNVYLKDRHHGKRRQRDIVVDAKLGGHIPISFLVSCKKYKRQLNSADIDHFNGELISSGANKGIVYCSGGFNANAIAKAKHLGISCCQLFTTEPAQLPDQIFLHQYYSVSQLSFNFTGRCQTESKALFGDLYAYSMPNGSLVLDQLVDFAAAAAARSILPENTLRGIPVTLVDSWKFKRDEAPAAQMEFTVQVGWKTFRAKIEAFLINGSYSITDSNFVGNQIGPAINIIDSHPGPDWEEVDVKQMDQSPNVLSMLIHPNTADDIREFLLSVAEQEA